MPKFTGKSQTFTIGGNALPCITGVEVTEQGTVAIAECAGGTHDDKALGLIDAKTTVHFAIDRRRRRLGRDYLPTVRS